MKGDSVISSVITPFEVLSQNTNYTVCAKEAQKGPCLIVPQENSAVQISEESSLALMAGHWFIVDVCLAGDLLSLLKFNFCLDLC